MAVGRGLMQMGRINVFPTTTSIFDIDPINGVAVCGDLVTFTVHVDGYIAPDGYVIIQDVVDGYIVGYAALSPISGTTSSATITAVMSNGAGNYVAYYSYPYVLQTVTDRDGYGKVLRSFGRSQSEINQYNVGFAGSITTITGDPAPTFCYHQDYDVTASVTTTGLAPITEGSVLFRIFDGYTAIADLDLVEVIAGTATGTILADTLQPDGYFLQALYLGADCSGPSNSPSGPFGRPLTVIGSDPTSVSTPVLLGTNCRTVTPSNTGLIMFTATVSGTVLPAPSVGTVIFTTTTPSILFLGSSYISDGVVPFTEVTPAMYGEPLPLPEIYVISTDGFASSGSFYLSTSVGTEKITYTGIAADRFTGCEGSGIGVIATASDVCAFAVPAGTFTSAALWNVRASYLTDGYCYATSTSSVVGTDITNC